VNFFVTLFTTMLVVCGNVNFTNLSRYSDLNEKTYRRHFEAEFAFSQFNAELVQAARRGDHHLLAVMDCSFIPKSGKATAGMDRYWNGCANRVEKGLEISVVGLVEVETEAAFAISAQQTLPNAAFPVALTRMEQYLYHLQTVHPSLPQDVRYLAVDGAYAKHGFVTGVRHLGLQVISKLRCDANLRYRYEGVQKRRGRPRKYDGKVDVQDLSRLTFVETVQPNVDLYTAIVWSVALGCWIRLAYLLDHQNAKKPRFVMLFSTDLEQAATDIYHLYRLRFQIEFIFRNAKQFTGLQDCQARDLPKLEFQFNASLTALNLARLDAQAHHTGDEPFVFSMATVKRRALMQQVLERFIAQLDLEPTSIKSHPNYAELLSYGSIAA
jgi:DDE superfamily endonuclease